MACQNMLCEVFDAPDKKYNKIPRVRGVQKDISFSLWSGCFYTFVSHGTYVTVLSVSFLYIMRMILKPQSYINFLTYTLIGSFLRFCSFFCIACWQCIETCHCGFEMIDLQVKVDLHFLFEDYNISVIRFFDD